MRFVRPIIQFDHRIEDPSLDRLQSVPDIRKGTGSYNTHSVIDIESLHPLLQIDFLYCIKYCTLLVHL